MVFCFVNLLGIDQSDIPTVDDVMLSSAATEIPNEQLKYFVLNKLGINETTLSHVKETERGDAYKIILECLVRWRNMMECAGEDAEQKLQTLLTGNIQNNFLMTSVRVVCNR